MRDERVIKVKSQKLRNIRTFLRRVLYYACLEKNDIRETEWRKLLHLDKYKEGEVVDNSYICKK